MNAYEVCLAAMKDRILFEISKFCVEPNNSFLGMFVMCI